ncbi:MULTISPECIES: AMP-binding protein [Actinosynnema]|uniref:AMP-binding protein n=1 Tax=Actinosynnema TaxID=40566 RepID=UPI0020A4E419|nr:AMP-binding protein [Actinosynnema pretiosum]MCP2092277.1 amino acid adenylation domain-containing protein [Actinosynnema pretiosum]
MVREVFARAQESVATLHEFLLAGARLTPEAPAVVECANGEVGTISYRQLERRVTSLAARLDELGLDVGDRVILESDTTPWSVTALLACSTLGLTYIPVSPETPAQRLRAIVDTVEPALHLQADTGRREGLPESVGLARFGPDGLAVDRAPLPRVRHRREITPADPAYMIFTSGTTGRPKGVVMSHRAILAFFRGMLAHGIVSAEDRVATTPPLQFDFSLLDIGLALGSGASVVPVPRDLLRWPRRFLQFLHDSRATQVDGVPSIWRPVLKHETELLAELGGGIKGILYSGEKFPLPELRTLREVLPGLRIVNCFGSSESVAASFTDVPDPLGPDVEELSIGHAHPGAEMTLIDDEDGGAVSEVGAVGHIHLRSGALFTAYWDDPEATARALVPDPLNPRSGQVVFRTGDLGRLGEDGELYFVGRADSQVKIRGNRVELGEIERRATDFPGVAAATAVLLPLAEREPVLVLYVTLSAGVAELEELELKAFCMEALPDYMVPQKVQVLDELPTTANGKVDRAALLARSGKR